MAAHLCLQACNKWACILLGRGCGCFSSSGNYTEKGASSCLCLQDRYYREKLGMHRLQPDSKRAVVQSYIEGLHWVLEYYYR